MCDRLLSGTCESVEGDDLKAHKDLVIDVADTVAYADLARYIECRRAESPSSEALVVGLARRTASLSLDEAGGGSSLARKS